MHAVVANAGIAGPPRRCTRSTLADWRETLATDLDGVFLTFRAFIPAMIERRDGSLIAISSMTGKRPLLRPHPLRRGEDGRHRAGPHARDRSSGPTASGSTRSARARSPGPGSRRCSRRQAAARGITEEEASGRVHGGMSPLGRLVDAPRKWPRPACSSPPTRAASITGEDLNVNAGVVMY